MAVPSSGPLQLRGDIALEVDGSATGTDVSLRALSNSAGFDAPDTMSEFYGYSSVSAPSVTTDAASDVTSSGFTANGNATADNGASITDRGFYVGTDSNYANNTKTSVGGTGTGTFSLAKTGLVFNTTYYITAYATNSIGEGRGSTITQATANASPPSVTTNSNSNISYNSMRANGEVTSDGGATVTERGFYFGTSSNYASNPKYTSGSGTGSYNRTMSGLSASTTYYATAYALNAAGETRGSTVSSSTSALTSYTGYSTNNNVYAGMEAGNWAVSSESLAAYGQYLHNQLGWQTDNSCINRSFTAGTSGSNPSNFCKSYTNYAVGFLPDYRKGSAAADHADSRSTSSISGQGLSQACCGDNNLQGFRANKTFLPYYGSSSHSYSSSPYTANSNGAEGFHTSGCPTTTGCGVYVSGSYTFTVSRP